MRARPDQDRTVRNLLGRAAWCCALAGGFAYPEASQRRAFIGALERLAVNGRRAVARSLRGAFHARGADELAATYLRLFGPGGTCSLHETAYGDGRRVAGRAQELADVNGFYCAFGFEIASAQPDLPDHIGTELEFYSLLLVKEAYAVAQLLREERRVTQRARARFLECHLGRWIGTLSTALAAEPGSAPYRELARAAQDLVANECRALKLRPEPAAGRLPFDELQGDNLVCPQEPGSRPVQPGTTP